MYKELCLLTSSSRQISQNLKVSGTSHSRAGQYTGAAGRAPCNIGQKFRAHKYSDPITGTGRDSKKELWKQPQHMLWTLPRTYGLDRSTLLWDRSSDVHIQLASNHNTLNLMYSLLQSHTVDMHHLLFPIKKRQEFFRWAGLCLPLNAALAPNPAM